MLLMPMPVPSAMFASVPRSRLRPARTSRVPGPLIWMSPGRALVVVPATVLKNPSPTMLPSARLLATERSVAFGLFGTMSRPAETIEMSPGRTFWR